MDTGTHLRAIWVRRWPVLAAALLVGLLVLALRTAQAPALTAEADLYLAVGDSDGGNSLETERLTAFYGEIIRDQRVIADVARRSGLPLTASRVRDQVSVTSPGKGKLTVTARAGDAQEAVLLADSAADALADGAQRDQAEALRQALAPLEQELASVASQLATLPAGDPRRQELRDRQDRAQQARFDRLSATRPRLDVVRRAQVDQVVRTPRPKRDATLAFLVSLILAAEVAALLASRRGGIDGRDPVPTLQSWTSLPVFRVGSSGTQPDESAAALRFLRRDPDRALYVAPLTSGDAEAQGIGQLLDTLAVLTPHLVWIDLAEPPAHALDGVPAQAAVVRPPAGSLDGVAGPQQLPTVVSAEVWGSPRLLSLAELLPGTCALLVDPRTARRADVLEAVRVLSFTDLPVRAVLVLGGRPRRSLRWGGVEAAPDPGRLSLMEPSSAGARPPRTG